MSTDNHQQSLPNTTSTEYQVIPIDNAKKEGFGTKIENIEPTGGPPPQNYQEAQGILEFLRSAISQSPPQQQQQQ